MDIIIKQLSVDLLDDYLHFFDNIAFVDNREWEGCYCVFYHHAGDVKDWMARSKNDNREMAIGMIRENRLKGFLAYRDGRPVAWCNANDKRAFSFDKNLSRVYGASDADVVSVVCFLVSHTWRRSGISTMLLKQVMDHCRQSGKRCIEAYPFKNAGSDSEHYHGPLNLYLKNGFYIDAEYDTYYIVKYDLP